MVVKDKRVSRLKLNLKKLLGYKTLKNLMRVLVIAIIVSGCCPNQNRIKSNWDYSDPALLELNQHNREVFKTSVESEE